MPEGNISRFANLNKDVLIPAITEINQLSRLTLVILVNKEGRTVVSVTISWSEKPASGKAKTKRELDSAKIGRQSRREGTTEMVVGSFAAVGSIKYSPYWHGIKRKSGCNMDNTMIADKFRSFCRERNIEETFANFCKKVGEV